MLDLQQIFHLLFMEYLLSICSEPDTAGDCVSALKMLIVDLVGETKITGNLTNNAIIAIKIKKINKALC